MIFKSYDCVVTRQGRIGRIDRTFFLKGKRYYSVQFGASGPFEDIRGDKLRAASENEEQYIEGVRAAP